MSRHIFTAKGKIIRSSDKSGIPGLKVEVWDKDLVFDDLVGESNTNEEGYFEITFTGKYFQELFFDRKPDLYFRVFRENKLIRSTENQIMWNVADEDIEVTIEIYEPENKKTREEEFKVSGQVFNSLGEPVENQNVQAMDVDLRGAAIYKTAKNLKDLLANGGFELLGHGTTDANGSYLVEYSSNAYRKYEIGLADVIVFAVDDGLITGRSRLAAEKDYRQNAILHWDISIQSSTKRGISEYAKHMQVIDPFMKLNKLDLYQLYPSDDQVSFMATETKQDASHVLLLVQADKLRNDYQKFSLTHELLYGVGRQTIPLLWEAILSKSRADLVKAIQLSIAENIISPQDAKSIDSFIENIQLASLQFASQAPQAATLFKAVSYATQNPAVQKSFALAYMQFSGKPEDFWKALAKNKEFTPDIIRSLQLTNQLSSFTGRHAALIEELQVNRKIKSPADLLDIDAEEWSSIIKKTGVPSPPAGETAQTPENYLSNLQGMLEAAYPTKRIAQLVASNTMVPSEAGVKEKLSAFFNSAEGFDIASSRVSEFTPIIRQVGGKQADAVTQLLLKLQRIYQVSISPIVMSSLLQRGYTSAYQISSMSQHSFIQTEKEYLGGTEIAASVYNRARAQVMRAQHTLLKIRDTQDRALPSKIVTASQQKAILDSLNKLN